MKKVIYIIIIIVVIVIGIVCGISMNKKEKQNMQTTNNNIEQTETTNTEDFNQINVIRENIIQNITEEKVENIISTEIFEEEPKTEEEKAIQIVKKDYGEISNIKISVEGMNEEGKQVVVVRNIQTTEALAFYFVNVSDGTFTKKEMN